jgi:hypothetical protein
MLKKLEREVAALCSEKSVLVKLKTDFQEHENVCYDAIFDQLRELAPDLFKIVLRLMRPQLFTDTIDTVANNPNQPVPKEQSDLDERNSRYTQKYYEHIAVVNSFLLLHSFLYI